MPGSLRLGKIARIEIYAHLSWFIILVLLTWSLAGDWFAQLFPGWATTTYWIAAFISALLLFVCVLTHELAHALVARASGLTVSNITLGLSRSSPGTSSPASGSPSSAGSS
jgi:Zn-dependent protease